MNLFRTGLLRAPEPPKLEFKSFLKGPLPPIPDTFGHQSLIGPRSWGMLMNDSLGDCTVAGAMHSVMLWNAIVGRQVNFTNTGAKMDYYAITGGSDTGADMVQVADYWRQTGMLDVRGNRHKIVAYLQVDPNLDHIDAACYWFDAVGLGIKVGEDEEQEFVDSRPWLTPGPVSGYHYVPMVGKANYRKVVTWGGIQDVGDDWLQANCMEVVAMISAEALANGKSSEGFDMDALMANLQELTS